MTLEPGAPIAGPPLWRVPPSARPGAIATAPFRGWGNSYAAYNDQPAMYGPNGWYGDWDIYAARNGMVCRPGTYFKGADGLQNLCQ